MCTLYDPTSKNPNYPFKPQWLALRLCSVFWCHQCWMWLGWKYTHTSVFCCCSCSCTKLLIALVNTWYSHCLAVTQQPNLRAHFLSPLDSFEWKARNGSWSVRDCLSGCLPHWRHLAVNFFKLKKAAVHITLEQTSETPRFIKTAPETSQSRLTTKHLAFSVILNISKWKSTDSSLAFAFVSIVCHSDVKQNDFSFIKVVFFLDQYTHQYTPQAHLASFMGLIVPVNKIHSPLINLNGLWQLQMLVSLNSSKMTSLNTVVVIIIIITDWNDSMKSYFFLVLGIKSVKIVLTNVFPSFLKLVPAVWSSEDKLTSMKWRHLLTRWQ